jgi:S-adenosylmethionine-dependent methyltransferase
VEIAAKTGSNHFQDDAGKYAAYLKTPEGRLRTDLAFANLKEFLAPDKGAPRALDLGCGTGAMGVRLAHLGFQVTLLDTSPAMLDLARHAAQEAGVGEKIILKLGDATRLSDYATGWFDVILCHNLLEYVDNFQAVLHCAARFMRDSSAIISILVRNQAGEVLKSALQTGDLAAAEQNLAADSARESLYGSKARLFTPAALDASLKEASLVVTSQTGVRVITDYLPATISRSTEYERIFALEYKLGQRPEFAPVARYTQWLAHSLVSQSKGDE